MALSGNNRAVDRKPGTATLRGQFLPASYHLAWKDRGSLTAAEGQASPSRLMPPVGFRWRGEDGQDY